MKNILGSEKYVKKILKFIGKEFIGFMIIACIFSDRIGYVLEKYLNISGFINKFGKTSTAIGLIIFILIVSYLIPTILIIIVKGLYKLNEKYNVVIAYNWKDFLASIGIALFICGVIALIIDFDTNMIVPIILLFILAIFGFSNYKKRFKIIQQLGYRGFSAIWRTVTTFLFGIISFPFFLIALIFNVGKATPTIVETGIDIASDPFGMGDDAETGTYINSDGETGFYVKNKDGFTIDTDGNMSYRKTDKDGFYYDTNGKIGKSRANKKK